MSSSSARKPVIPARPLRTFDGKMSHDTSSGSLAIKRDFPADGFSGAEVAANTIGSLYTEGSLVAEDSIKAEAYMAADEGAAAKGSLAAQSVDTVPVINEKDIAHRFSKAAKQYNSIASIQRVIAEQALINLPNCLQGQALDIGCGTGVHTQALCSRGASATGVDIAEGMLAFARKKYSDPIFMQGSALDLPFSENTFSTVFSSMALQWVSDAGLAAKQIARVLKKGGVAELAIMVAGSFDELKTARKVAQLAQADTAMPTAAQWADSFKQSGLSLQRVITKDYVDTHNDIMSLLRSVKGVGAGATGRKQPPLNRRDIKKLAMAYCNARGVESKLPLTYRVSHFRLEKR
ncbi:methyltransferase domain-containing protein [Alteromonas sp. IB21]|uniref:methyltransferase domain-containing protein n=1 Tax=Alteromonas sp. IB21 TaxID=2779369 RepID=UPI0018E72F81|nr:methyltransferase domain-containing protein [Alteromonas sp. IB21]MBJ2129533.1 methyltransferase domain-containing protein [Alteromonas sp. IB21]